VVAGNDFRRGDDISMGIGEGKNIADFSLFSALISNRFSPFT